MCHRSLVSCLAISWLIWSIAASAATPTPVLLTDNPRDDDLAGVSPNLIVWRASLLGRYELEAFDGSQIRPLSSERFSVQEVRVDGAEVAWTAVNTTEQIRRFADGVESILTDANLRRDSLRTSGERAVWAVDEGGDPEVLYFDGDGVRRLTDNETSDTQPRISGSHVVWRGCPGDTRDCELFSFDGQGVRRITHNQQREDQHQVSGPHVVWSGLDEEGFDDWEIYLWDGSAIAKLTDNDTHDRHPGISGRFVAWQGRGGGASDEIFLYDGVSVRQLTSDGLTKQPGVLVADGRVTWRAGPLRDVFHFDGDEVRQLTNNGGIVHRHVSVSGPNVVWSGADAIGQRVPRVILFDGATTRSIASAGNFAEISGSDVVWEFEGDVFLYDGARTVQLSATSYPDRKPRVSEGQVFWESGQVDSEVFQYTGGEVLQLTDDEVDAVELDFSGGRAAWRSGTFQQAEIFLYDGHEVRQLTDNDYTDVEPRVSASTVAWSAFPSGDTGPGASEIFVSDGGEIVRLTDDERSDLEPRVSGGRVAWRSCDESCEVWLYEAGASRRLGPSDASPGTVALDAGRVAWLECLVQDRFLGCLDADAWSFDGRDALPLNDFGLHSRAPQLSPEGVSWVACELVCEEFACGCRDSRLLLDGGLGPRILAELPTDQVVVDGRQAAWAATDGGLTGLEIFLFDGERTVQLTENDVRDSDPDLAGGWLAWSRTHDDGGFPPQRDIYAVPEPSPGLLRGVAAAGLLAATRWRPRRPHGARQRGASGL